ncbi:putative RNA-binding protein C1827.05c [Camellia lanceoleosa]|nr:putative RNA-binding protein C1827.05c [Camellia lanceoleosa]
MGAKAKKAMMKKLKKESGPGHKLPKSETTENKATVLYIGRIPHGFYENEMEGFFKQFGTIKKLRLAKNKKTGKSKHFGFIEFESPEVAKIVSECMLNYLITLEEHKKLVGEILKHDQKKHKKIEAAGIDYECAEIWLVEYNAALASICFMILLGFVDDVLDVPWTVVNPKLGLSDYEEQEIIIAINCCYSSVDGLCWTSNYSYTKASHSLSWALDFGSRVQHEDWNSSFRRSLFAWEMEEVGRLKGLLLVAPELSDNVPDKLIWNADSSGVFSVLSTYQWCESSYGPIYRGCFDAVLLCSAMVAVVMLIVVVGLLCWVAVWAKCWTARLLIDAGLLCLVCLNAS